MVKWIDCVTYDPELSYVHVAGTWITNPKNVYDYLTGATVGAIPEVYHPYDKCIISRDLNKW